MKQRGAVIAVVLAILVAAYTGFRMPNRWAVTLQAVSIFDGIHRRFLVGTLLRPFTLLLGYHYALFAVVGFAVLGALLYLLARAAIRTPSWSRRLIAIAWFLLPAGGFLFDEVGYLEQVMYLALALAVWLALRGQLRGAAVVLALLPCVHEIAILTVVPLFVAVMVRHLSPKTVVAVVAPAVVVTGIVLLLPHASTATIEHVQAGWDRDGFPYRADEMQLFVRTQAQSWDLYSFSAAMRFVMPVTVLLLVAAVLIRVSDRPVVFAASLGAIAAPLLLVYAGWDVNRWQFFTIANFAVVIWVMVENELGKRQIALLVVTALVLARMPLGFIQTKPRELDTRSVATFVEELASGDLFAESAD